MRALTHKKIYNSIRKQNPFPSKRIEVIVNGIVLEIVFKNIFYLKIYKNYFFKNYF